MKFSITIFNIAFAANMALAPCIASLNGTAGAEDKSSPAQQTPRSSPPMESDPCQAASDAYANCTDAAHDESHSPLAADPAFDCHIDFELLGQAIRELDAPLLTDAGLQVAEGERVLRRRHKSGVTAVHILRKAARLAILRQDEQTLERLRRAAQSTDDKSLARNLADAQKLAQASRAEISAGIKHQRRDISSETFLALQRIHQGLDRAEILGNPELLAAAESIRDRATDLSKSEKDAIAQRIAALRAVMPEQQHAEDRTLAKLTESSRGGPFGNFGSALSNLDPMNSQSTFWHTQQTYSTFDDPPEAPRNPSKPLFFISSQGRVYESGTYLGNARYGRLQSGRLAWYFQIPHGWFIYRYAGDSMTRRSMSN